MNKIKQENLKKLESFKEDIFAVEPICFSEAKKLYQEMIMEPDSKKQIREQLILKTLPVLYKNIANSGLMYIAYQDFDILDIMQEAIELWILKIDEGALAQASSYSYIFSRFHFILSNKFLEGRFLANLFFLTNSLFSELLFKYIRVRKFLNSFNDARKLFSGYQHDVLFFFEEIYRILDSEINYFEEEANFSYRQISIMEPYLCQKALNRLDNKRMLELLVQDQLSFVEDKVFFEKMKDYLKKLPITPKSLEMTFQYYGIDHPYSLSLKEIAYLNGVVVNRVSQRIMDTKNKLKFYDSRDDVLRRIYEDIETNDRESYFFSLRKK